MTIDELTTPMTVDEAKTAIYTAMATKGVKTTSWKTGAVVRTIVACVALVLAAFSRLQALIAAGGFLATAEGQWLTLVAHYVYGVTRSTGSFASGVVTFDNAGGGVYSGAAGDLVVRSGATDKTYRNTAAYSIGALATGVDVAFEAVELGSDSTAPAATIDELVTTLSGVTCTNVAALVGTDEETDVELRTRCAAKLGTLSPDGPADAYSYVARSTLRADGTPIGVTRVKTTPDGLGGVGVIVATGSGGVTGTEGDPATDLGAIAAAIWEQVEPLAVTATVASATAYPIAVTYELWVRASGGLTAGQIGEEVEAALTAYLAAVPIGGDGGFVRLSALEAVVGSVRPDTTRVTLTLPGGDTALLVASAPVAGTVTATAIHIGS